MVAMGGGAGGGGAGGGGAGGGGAGGGGAGGGGAGGGGAGGLGHAGGGSSPILNTALAVSHDALVGFWSGEADPGLNPLAHWPGTDDPLKTIDSSRRIDLLIAEMTQRCSAAGTLSDVEDGVFTPGSVVLTADDKMIFSTTGPDLPLIQSQLVWVRNYTDLRFDRVGEINRQLDDIVSFFGSVFRLDGAARQHTLEFLLAANRVVYALEMRAKWLTWTPRPIDLSPNVQPMIQTPDHSSYPSGHSTEAFAMATLLERLMTGQSAADGVAAQTMPFRLAHRIAVNRTVAGVHYPIDSAAGAAMGCMIGEAIWSMLHSDPGNADAPPNWCGTFTPGVTLATENDFLLSNMDTGWTQNAVHTAEAGPITLAYRAALGREW